MPDILIIYNPHPLNIFIYRLSKRVNPHCNNMLFLHEPHKPDKLYYGFLGFFYFTIVDYTQRISLRHVNTVILPSPYAFELFTKKFPNFKGKCFQVNLLVPDKPCKLLERKYFTFAGGINRGKGFQDFIDLINYAYENNLKYNFKIITSCNIKSYLKNLNKKAFNSVIVHNPKKITDYELNRAHAESIGFFLLHNTATQSGGMTIAFMHGTPVIARNIKAFSQYIIHKKNSYLVRKQFFLKDLVDAMEYLSKNQKSLSIESRKTFEEQFSDKNWDINYKLIFEN